MVRNFIGIKEILFEFFGFEVNLKSVVIWVIRDMYFYGLVLDEVVFNLKIDGCFFFGKCICIFYFNCMFFVFFIIWFFL